MKVFRLFFLTMAFFTNLSLAGFDDKIKITLGEEDGNNVTLFFDGKVSPNIDIINDDLELLFKEGKIDKQEKELYDFMRKMFEAYKSDDIENIVNLWPTDEQEAIREKYLDKNTRERSKNFANALQKRVVTSVVKYNDFFIVYTKDTAVAENVFYLFTPILELDGKFYQSNRLGDDLSIAVLNLLFREAPKKNIELNIKK